MRYLKYICMIITIFLPLLSMDEKKKKKQKKKNNHETAIVIDACTQVQPAIISPELQKAIEKQMKKLKKHNPEKYKQYLNSAKKLSDSDTSNSNSLGTPHASDSRANSDNMNTKNTPKKEAHG